jgi:predicted DNA-binding transcriptional regulator AlpA
MGVTRETLEPLIEQIADAVTARVQAAPAPALLDRNGLAHALGLSVATIDRLARAGLPSVRLIDARRFVLADVLAWLKSREQPK